MNFKYIITSTLVMLATFFMVSSAIAGAEGHIGVVDDIQVLGLTRALSTGPIEFSSGGMANELNGYCAEVERSTESVAYSIGDEIQRVGLENALLPNC